MLRNYRHVRAVSTLDTEGSRWGRSTGHPVRPDDSSFDCPDGSRAGLLGDSGPTARLRRPSLRACLVRCVAESCLT
jgi:hypothetical protein